SGRWHLVRLRRRGDERQTSWLLMKVRDDEARSEAEFSVIKEMPNSVKSRERIDDVREATEQRATRKTTPASGSAAGRLDDRLPRGVRLTHPDRVVDRTAGVTKLDVMRYYIEAAPRLLAHLRGRPVALVRGPEGVGGTLFFQKHAGTLRIPGIKELDT